MKVTHEMMIVKLDAHHKRMMAHQEAMQSIEEHQEIPKTDAAVILIKRTEETT
jgi:hypothetical protein